MVEKPSEVCCSVKDCKEPLRARGFCKAHYNAWYHKERKSAALLARSNATLPSISAIAPLPGRQSVSASSTPQDPTSLVASLVSAALYWKQSGMAPSATQRLVRAIFQYEEAEYMRRLGDSETSSSA